MASQLADVFGLFKIGASACLLLGVTACALAQDTTQVEYRFANGSVSSRGGLVGGVPAGYWMSFYEDGTRKSEGNWEGGLLDGEWVFYDEAGRVETTLNYRLGEKDGEEIRWDSLGVKVRSLPWNRDTLDGWERGFDQEGVEVEQIPWSAGSKDGVALEYASVNGTQERIVRRLGYRGDLLRWVEDVNRYDDQGRQTGKWMSFWSSGRVKSEGPYARGKREGVFKFFNRNGDLERTETYKNGERVVDAPEAVALDLRKAFHPNGTVSRSGPWREDTPMGTHRFFDEQGHLVHVKVFREGVLNAMGSLDSLGRRTGDWTLFYASDGKRKAEGPYLEGKRHGEWKYYATDSRLEQEGEFRMGEWHGQWRWFHADGSLHRDERYRKGREDGFFVELSEAGDTLAVGDYERGFKQGRWTEHVNDDRRVGAYLDGERDGLWTHSAMDGGIRFEGAYVAGIPTGQHITFWPSGVRASVGSFEGGLKDGNWRYFDANGVLRLVRQYKSGRIVKVNGTKTDK